MIQSFKYILLAAFVSIFGSTDAQMLGNYTIGGTSGSSNFKNWTEFISEWNKNGSSGAVTVSVLSDDSVSAPLEFKQHASNPSTSSNKLVIDGNGKKLKARLSREVIHLNGIDHVTLKNLQIENASTDAGLLGLRFSNAADSNVIDACVIVFTNLKSVESARDSGAYIAFCNDSGAITRTSVGHRGRGNRIKNCSLYSALSESTGPFYGIYDQQGSRDYTQNTTHNSFDSNHISTFFSIGILMQYVNGEQCLGNRITREKCNDNSATDSLMIGIFCLDSRSDQRSMIIDGNEIVHLPFKNGQISQSSGFILKLFGINMWSVIGGKNTVQVRGNRLEDLLFHESFHGIFSQYCEQVNIARNTLYQIRGNMGYSFGIYSQYGDDVHIDSNVIRKIDFGSVNGGDGVLIFGYEMSSGTWGKNTIIGNTLDSNTAYTELFMIPVMYLGNWEIASNLMVHNKCVFASMFSLGRTVGIYNFFCGNLEIHDNIIAHNFGEAETYYIYSTNYNANQSLDIRHNTLFDSFQTSNYHISALMYLDDDSRTEIVGNILQGKGSGDVYPMFLNTISILGDVKYNSIHLSGYQNENWAFETVQYSDFQDWLQYGARDSQTFWLNPLFVNVAQNDFRSQRFKNQNNVPFNAQSTKDIYGKRRNTRFCDRGAVLDTLNLALLNFQTLPDSFCSGYHLLNGVFIRNEYRDTVDMFELVYEKNNQTETERFYKKIAPRDTLWVNFNKPLTLNEWGESRFKVYLSSSNDRYVDDTLTHRLWVKRSPGGSLITAELDSTQTNLPIVSNSVDVLLCNKEVAYRVSAPRGYTRSDYGLGKKWLAEISVTSSGGKAVSGGILVPPDASKDLKWSFKTSDTQWEDSFLWVRLKISDLLNACDTVYTKRLFIEPSAKVAFSYDSLICLGDTVFLKNKTEFFGASSYLNYQWSFGNGDSSIDYEPLLLFKDTGLYSVRLKVTTQPYNYEFEKLHFVRVNTGPSISFTRDLACENKAVQFILTRKGTNAQLVWDFGDGKPQVVSKKDTVSYVFTKRGNYDVVLTGTENTCTTRLVQRVSVFEQPQIQYAANTSVCNNRSAIFQDKTQMQTAVYGVRWEFGDSTNFSTQKLAAHRYASPGMKTVKYVVKSEFGCSDSVNFGIEVNPSPTASFNHNDFCKNKATEFKNTTSVVPGTLRQFQWNLNGLERANSENWNLTWNDTGFNRVSLIVRLDNGCSDTFHKDLKVLNSAAVDFTFDTLCAGDSVSFQNRSLEDPNLRYTWYFENDSLEQFQCKKIFDAVILKETPVRLMVRGKEFCQDEITKMVRILPRPNTCNFAFFTDYESSYYGVRLVPQNDQGVLGGQLGTNYTWDVEGLGRGNTAGINGEYKLDLNNNGTFVVKMSAITQEHSCRCMSEQQIVLDRLEKNTFLSNAHSSLSPNPITQGTCFLRTDKEITEVILVSAEGRIWPLPWKYSSELHYELMLPDVSSGVYQVKFRGPNWTDSQGVVILRP